jgi:hypothetical protein
VRSKVEKPLQVPVKYRRFRSQDWPEGWGEYVEAREAWAAAQSPVVISGTLYNGNPFSYTCGPLGDLTDLIRARREARMLDLAPGVDCQ